jgi:hypothetical protein
MFIINPYRYASHAITDFYSSIHTSSLYFTLGPVGFNFSSSLHSSSLEFTLGVIGTIYSSSLHSSSLEFTLGYSIPTITSSIYNTVELISKGTGSQLFITDNSIRNYVDLTVT